MVDGISLHVLGLAAGQAIVGLGYLLTFFVLGAPLLRGWPVFRSTGERLTLTLGVGLASFAPAEAVGRSSAGSHRP